MTPSPRLLGPIALALLVALAAPAAAQQKTAKECNAEWTAQKAELQAQGTKKKDFIAQCRDMSETTPPSAAQAPAAGQQKTAKECNAEWTAQKAELQAQGTKKKDFVAQCRGTSGTTSGTTSPPPAPAPAANTATKPAAVTKAPAAAAAGQFASEAQAKAHCPGDTVVWANLKSGVYHFSGNRNYGNTKEGAYMCEGDTAAAGLRAAKNEKHP
jgi:hypothetical protein